MANKLFAAIDVGSHAIGMKIVEIKPDHSISVLEQVHQPVSLGRDTFANGKLSPETVDQTCEILNGFVKLMNDYGVKHHRAVATSAIREAGNKSYILDRIKNATGLRIEVITNAEERFFTYKGIDRYYPKFKNLRQEGVIILDIGSGSVQITAFAGDNMLFSHNLKVGSLRVREILADLEGRTLDFPKILEEYLESFFDALHLNVNNEPFTNLIVVGAEIPFISAICNKSRQRDKLSKISKKSFDALYSELLYKQTQRLVEDYGIAYDSADIILPSMMIIKKFMSYTKKQGLLTPMISVGDGIIAQHCGREEDAYRENGRDIISSARMLAEKYHYDKAHSEDVEKKALAIFDALTGVHDLSNTERLLLILAAILHDVGKFVNIDKHYEYSYEIIVGSDLLGLSKSEKRIAANVARYHSTKLPARAEVGVSAREWLILSKLTAILRLADALDKSHKQKIMDISLELDGNKLYLYAYSKKEVLLEQWSFESNTDFFVDVFGLEPVFKHRRVVR